MHKAYTNFHVQNHTAVPTLVYDSENHGCSLLGRNVTEKPRAGSGNQVPEGGEIVCKERSNIKQTERRWVEHTTRRHS